MQCCVHSVTHTVFCSLCKACNAVFVWQSPFCREQLYSACYLAFIASTVCFCAWQVAVFDTAYHQTMPASSYMYALPYELYEKHAIRKYGFHGTSHRYLVQEASKLLGKPESQLNLIICHIGACCPCFAHAVLILWVCCAPAMLCSCCAVPLTWLCCAPAVLRPCCAPILPLPCCAPSLPVLCPCRAPTLPLLCPCFTTLPPWWFHLGHAVLLSLITQTSLTHQLPGLHCCRPKTSSMTGLVYNDVTDTQLLDCKEYSTC